MNQEKFTLREYIDYAESIVRFEEEHGYNNTKHKEMMDRLCYMCKHIKPDQKDIQDLIDNSD